MRESGLYWVKYNHYSEWTVAEWCSDFSFWMMIGGDGGFRDSDMDDIDERRIVREEPTE